MGKSHDRLLKFYSNQDVLSSILNEKIKTIITETKIRDVFTDSYSYLTPDIYVFPEHEEYIWIGEIKGNYNMHSLNKSYFQLNRYIKEVHRYKIKANGFIIVGDYIEIIKNYK